MGFLFCFAGLCLSASNDPTRPLEQIKTYVESQDEAMTAYDIAAHFDKLTATTYGAKNVFNAAETGGFIHSISVAALSSTHFVVAYRDVGNSNHGTAIVGQVSGTTISTYGAENVFNAASTNFISVTALSSTHFVVAYDDVGNSGHGTAIVGQVSGTTITAYGAENVFNAASIRYPSVAALSSTHFVVAYQDEDNSSHGKAIVGQVSGTTISTFGAETVFNAASTYQLGISYFEGTNSIVIAYRDIGDGDKGKAVIGEVSGTTISFNAATEFTSKLFFLP